MGRLRHDPVAQFAVAGLVAMILIAAATAAVSRHTGTTEAIRDAKELTAFAGHGIVEPNLTRGVLAGRPRAVRRFDLLMHRRVLRDGIVRVKIWSRDGHVIYSDERRLIGARYPLGRDELGALRVAGRRLRPVRAREPVRALATTSCSRSTCRSAPPAGSGCCSRPTTATARSRPTAGACGWPSCPRCSAACCCCSSSTSRSRARSPGGCARASREREALLEHALDASQTERRLIAADLHDGVVQDLLGVSYSLAADAARVNGSDPEAGAALRKGGDADARDGQRAARPADRHLPAEPAERRARRGARRPRHRPTASAASRRPSPSPPGPTLPASTERAALPLRAGVAAQRVQARRRVARPDPRERDRRRRPCRDQRRRARVRRRGARRPRRAGAPRA